MNSRFLVFLPLIVIPLLGGCATTPDSAAPAGSPEIKAAASKGSEESLQQGMSADAVKAIMGEPAEIQPYANAGTGKAEVWIYRRTTMGSVRQVQVGTQSTPITQTAMNGPTATVQNLGSIDVPIFKDEITRNTETISLLMVDGRFVVQKHAFSEKKEYR